MVKDGIVYDNDGNIVEFPVRSIYCSMCKKYHKYRAITREMRITTNNPNGVLSFSEYVNLLTSEELHARAVNAITNSNYDNYSPLLNVLPDKVEVVKRRTRKEHWSDPKKNTMHDYVIDF